MGLPDNKRIKLYVRFPEKIVDEQQVKDLHPAIIKVTLPRQKSRRWCTIQIYSSSQSIVKELKKKTINGAQDFIKNPDWGYDDEDDYYDEMDAYPVYLSPAEVVDFSEDSSNEMEFEDTDDDENYAPDSESDEEFSSSESENDDYNPGETASDSF